MKKRILALILALCLMASTLFTLSSCGGDDTPDTPDDSGVENSDPQGNGGEADKVDTDLVDDEYPEDIAEDIF